MRRCSVAGCGRPCDTRGLCRMHHLRVARGGSVDSVRRPGRKPGGKFLTNRVGTRVDDGMMREIEKFATDAEIATTSEAIRVLLERGLER